MTATHLYRGTPSGEILDADGKVVGRIVPVEPVLNMQWAFIDQMIKAPGFPACYGAMLSAAPADWSQHAVTAEADKWAAVRRCVEIVRKWEYSATYISDAIKAAFPEAWK